MPADLQSRYDQIQRLCQRPDGPLTAGGPLDSWSQALDKHGGLLPERQRLHRELIGQVLAEARTRVPADGHAVVLGGLGGSGKDFMLESRGDLVGVHGDDHLVVDPDEMKALLIGTLKERGGLPRLTTDQGQPLSPMELSSHFHRESSMLADELQRKATNERLNVVLNQTMRSADGAERSMSALAAKGYRVDGMYVHVPVDQAVAQARDRYAVRQEEWLASDGERGLGGRVVPEYTQRNCVSEDGTYRPAANFDRLASDGRFDRAVVVDNTGRRAGPDGRPGIVVAEYRDGVKRDLSPEVARYDGVRGARPPSSPPDTARAGAHDGRFELHPNELRSAAGALRDHAAEVESHGRSLAATTEAPVGHGAVGEVVDGLVKRGLRVASEAITTAVSTFQQETADGLEAMAERTEQTDAEAAERFSEQ